MKHVLRFLVLLSVIGGALVLLLARPAQYARVADPKPWLSEPASWHNPAGAARLAEEAHPLEDQAKQAQWIVISEDAIRERLRDPDSASFSDVFFSIFEGHPIVCGHVNAKNGFGGFIGSQRFIASGKIMSFLEEDMPPGQMSRSWGRMCRTRASRGNNL